MSVEPYRVRAVNEPGSQNLVHDDEFARKLGFDSGLVPGVTVYGYMAVLPIRHWGQPWIDEGAISARFLKPVYDGQVVTVSGGEAGNGLDLELRNPAGEVCATGHATLDVLGPPAEPAQYPAAALPDPVEPPAFVEGRALGSLRTTIRLADYAWPARLANEVLVANVQLPPWLHVESRTRHLGPVRDGEAAEVRALVAGLWERRGHRFVDLDVLVLGDRSTPVAHVRHIAIYEIAQLRGAGAGAPLQQGGAGGPGPPGRRPQGGTPPS